MINDTLQKYYLYFAGKQIVFRRSCKQHHTQQKRIKMFFHDVSRDTNYRHYTKIDNKIHCWR